MSSKFKVCDKVLIIKKTALGAFELGTNVYISYINSDYTFKIKETKGHSQYDWVFEDQLEFPEIFNSPLYEILYKPTKGN